MKRVLFTALGLAPAITGGGLVPGDPGGPVLSTPGTATWTTETTDSGIRAIYSITDDTILDWGQLDVPFGDELVFDFVDGSSGSVGNMLGGGTTHLIDGSVFSNGNVGFFSPGSDLVVNGSVTAASVTLATLGVDSGEFLQKSDLHLTGNGGINFLSVNGSVTATSGDVVLAGSFIDISDSAEVNAAGTLHVGGYSEGVNLWHNGRYRLGNGEGMGFVLNLGSGNASKIDIRAGTEIVNGGRIQSGSGNGKIYLEVGAGGQITNEGTGIIVGDVSTSGTYDNDGTTFGPDEGDTATGVNSSALKIPALRRPDGSKVSRGQLVRNDAPMAASSDTSRDGGGGSLAVAGNSRGSLMKRASFFGMRGGKGADKKKSR